MAVTINGASPTTAQQREFAAAMGLPVLLQTVTVGTAQQDLDFTSLDLDADGTYRIELVVSPNSTGVQEVFCYYNGDLTAANYQSQYLVGAVSSTLAGRSTTATAAFGGSPTSTAFTSRSSLNVSKVAGKNPILTSLNSYDVTGLAAGVFAHRWTGTANVTAIKLRHTSLFGVGTVAKIYKV